MNPSVAVAFMTKLKLIFETDAQGKPQADTFLAFQNGSFPVSKNTFYFMQPAKYGLGNNETGQWMMNFDKTFNFVATVDDVITSTPDELDQVYYETLQHCQPATSRRTPEQEARYQAALSYLQQTVPGDDSTPVLVLDNYQRYENAYKEATTAYKNGKLAAEMAQGDGAAEVKQAWQEAEPQLKRACDLAQLTWETKGRKTEVEGQLATFINLSGSSPLKTVADFRSDYELFGQATALDPMANEINYLPTQFSPINFFEDSTPWQPLSLDKSEINSLLQRASPRLKNIFQLEPNTDIENITLEYTVVELIRNWLHVPDFLLQRFWKLAPGTTPLADALGGGRLPAYPTKLLFVRNVKITSRNTGQSIPKGPLLLTAQLFAKVQPTAVPLLQSKAATFQVKTQRTQLALTDFRLRQAKVAQPVATPTTPAKPTTPTRLTTFPVAHLQAATLATATAKPAVAPAATVRATGPLLWASLASVKATPPRTPLLMRPVSMLPIIKLPINTKPVTQSTGSPVFDTTVQKELELLAFFCRRMPVCPNPDPNLPWS